MAPSVNVSLAVTSNSSECDSDLVTPTETNSNASLATSRPVSPTVVSSLNHDAESDAESDVTTEEICADGDTLLNIRILRDDVETGVDCLKRAPQARFRVSSTVLRLASYPLKECLDSTTTPGGHGPLSNLEGERMKAPVLFPTKSPDLWAYRDDNHSLSLVLKPWCQYAFDQESLSYSDAHTLSILMNCLHLIMVELKYQNHGYCGLIIIRITEIAWGLGCELPMVPWINLWLPMMDPWKTFDALEWFEISRLKDSYWAQYMGIVVGFVMGDAAAFQFWTREVILSTSQEEVQLEADQAGSQPGGVHSIIHEGLREKRKHIILQLRNFLNQAFVRYCSSQSNSAKRLINSVLLGALMRAVHTEFGPRVAFPIDDLEYEGSPYSLLKVIKRIQKKINSTWKAFTMACSDTEQRKVNSTFELDPGISFCENAEKVLADFKGLDLEDYRPGVRKVLDVNALMGHWANL